MRVIAGSTDVTAYFKLIHPTTGVPQKNLTVASLFMTYIRDRTAIEATKVTGALSNIASPHSDYKVTQVSATYAPGFYRADFPDAAFVSGVNRVQLGIKGSVTATIDPSYIECEIGNTPYDELFVATFTEPNVATPTSTPTLVDAVKYLYFTLTNKKTTNATYFRVWNRAEASVLFKSSRSDAASIYTQGEMERG